MKGLFISLSLATLVASLAMLGPEIRASGMGASVGTAPAGMAAFLADTCKGSPIAPGDLGLPHRDA